MWVEFVVGSRLAPRVFLWFFGLPSSTKTNISKFQFDQDGGPAWKPARAGGASSLNIAGYFI